MQTNFMGVTPKFKLLAVRETPIYRVATDPSVCTDIELLSALIGGSKQFEIADAVLAHFNGDLHQLYQASVAELVSITGVGEAIAARVKSAFVLSLRLTATQTERATINSPEDAAKLCADMAAFDVEHLRVIILNTRLHVLAVTDVYKGSVNSAQIRMGEVFRPAIQRNASSVIFAHNHPSGDPSPSPDDAAVTRSMAQAGRLLEIDVLDHLVIGQGGGWISLKQKGLGFA
ncbi:MAG: DNA repair protein RadC [Chloroflexi bacterium]|nr:DNA repair protein RadC [Chloroflexota bacterium]MBI3340812.1 DNA repair protein RadC [Chloroflexota bacterium]